MVESGYGVPPLKNLPRILDARGIPRAQLVRRSKLSAPTIRRAASGNERVRATTARELARVLAVPQECLYSDLSEEDLRSAARLPSVTAGKSYSYLEPAQNGKHTAQTNGGDRKPAADGASKEKDLREVLRHVEARLEAMEEILLELASRPVAEFDVQLTERKGER